MYDKEGCISHSTGLATVVAYVQNKTNTEFKDGIFVFYIKGGVYLPQLHTFGHHFEVQ